VLIINILRECCYLPFYVSSIISIGRAFWLSASLFESVVFNDKLDDIGKCDFSMDIFLRSTQNKCPFLMQVADCRSIGISDTIKHYCSSLYVYI